jgi:putative glutamine amidotransferase
MSGTRMSGARRRPAIGITMYGPDQDPVAPAVSLPIAYAEAIARAGGTPLFLPPAGPTDALLEQLDGLVLAGGGDIDPALHTDRTHETVYMVTPERDSFELTLARAAIDRPDVAVLGICRGMQMLNVALEGDLELHLPDIRGETVLHRAPPRLPIEHKVELRAGCRMEEILGSRSLQVCSWHHQEIRALGRGLDPVAWAPDGVIEAVEYPAHPFALGVQWHPELQPDAPHAGRLFAAFVEAAAALAAER